MQRIIFFLLCFFVTPVLFSQDVRLSDSVIYIDNKPIAFYNKELNSSVLKYDMEVYNSNDDVLIKAEVIKFSAPVPELKPFFYYELTFPPIADTFSVYINDEAFPLLLAKLIRDYKLINNGNLNTKSVKYFKEVYPGGPELITKINEFSEYLQTTRYIREQVIRDRTKPVTIVDNRIIMQDGVQIGKIVKLIIDQPVGNMGQQIPVLASQHSYNETVAGSIAIFLMTERQAHCRGNFSSQLVKGDPGYQLYQISKTKNSVPGSVDDLVFRRICFMIEDFSL